MKKNLIILFILTASFLFAQIENDKTLSPYFFVKGDADIDELPLKSTSAVVNIAGVIADVTVNQIYKNEGKKTLEAIYVFPASTRAAVYGMKMTIGNRTIEAKIEEYQKARQKYEQARQEGKSASLLEQKRPNVFQMNVANILPGDEIKVELRYTELLVPEKGVYEFVYPTVVGPRYSNISEDTAPPEEGWIKNPYQHQEEKPTYTFDILVKLSCGIPIQAITSPSHKVNIKYEAPSIAVIKLSDEEKYGGNRDFIIKYKLQSDQIESGLLLFEGKKENFFLAMIQPPKRINLDQIAPREYIFIMDVSGSMYGFPINISKLLLKDLISKLRPQDLFNVLLFSGSSYVLSEKSLPATENNIRRAIDIVERQQGGGGTELLPALQKALNLPRSEGYSRIIVIATDGYVTVEKQAFELIRNNLGQANMFAFGIGTSVNRHLIEGMAYIGMGESFVITNPQEAPTKAKEFENYIQSPLLTDIKINYEGFAAYDVEPPSIPDLFAERPIIIFGKWQGFPKGKIRITGSTANGIYEKEIIIDKVKPLASHSALKYLWARHRIKLLSDFNNLGRDYDLINKIVNLGLQYNLLTNYTSFVAIDTVIRSDGNLQRVKQPLPMPQGVSDYAIGESAQYAIRMPSAEKKESAKAEYASALPLQIPKVSEDKYEKFEFALEKVVNISVNQNKKEIENLLRRYVQELKLGDIRQIKNYAKIKVEIVLNEKGSIKKISFDDDISKNLYYKNWLSMQIMKWKFPETKKEISITFTILLRAIK